MVARVVARTELNDLNAGSVLLQILGSVAEELEHIELRMKSVRDSYFLEGVFGSELDERVAELPPNGVIRKGAVSARGTVTIQRTVSAGDAGLSVPVGGLIVSSTFNPGVTYTNDAVISFATDAASANANVVSLVPGTSSNTAAGTINSIDLSPSPSVFSVTNAAPIAGGQTRESDASLRARAKKYLKSLSRCQRPALEYKAITFTGSNGDTFKNATVYEDVSRPGYCELVVDDKGTTANGVSLGAIPPQVTVPSTGISQLYFQAPAQDAPKIFKKASGASTFTELEPDVYKSDFTIIEERGVVYINNPELFSTGDTIAVGVVADTSADLIDATQSGYYVYGASIKELQDQLEGDLNKGAGFYGFRAAGTRVRVVPPTAQYFDVEFTATYTTASEVALFGEQAQLAVVDYVNELAPGQPALLAEMSRRIMDISGVTNVLINEPQTDVYPKSMRHSLRVEKANITVV
jgi:uncharacterized phage protein gp47/JayE